MIAVRIDPRPREQLGGYLLRIAGHLQRPPRDLLLAAGAAASGRVSTRGLSGFPPEDSVRAIAHLLGVEEQVLSEMTLARFVTGLFGFEHRTGTAGATSSAPALLTGGVYCPVCIQHGHWDLWWKTGLVAVCLDHRRYVLARCPSCGTGVAPDTVLTEEDGDSTQLRHGSSYVTSCAHATDLLGPRPDVAHLHAQERINRLLDRAITQADAADTCRTLLRWTEYLHRALSDRPYLAGNYVAVDGHALGTLLSDALDLTTSTDPASHPTLLRAVHQQRARGRAPQRGPSYHPLRADDTDALNEAINIACASARPSVQIPPPGNEGGTGWMPQVVPLSEFNHELSDALHHVGYDRARMFAALSAAAPAGTPRWARIGAPLRLPAHVAAKAGNVLKHIEDTGHAGTFWDAIDRTRTALATSGVDFQRRAQQVEHDPKVLAAATTRWPVLAEFPTSAVLQWLMDRWACQYVHALPPSIMPRTHKAPDYRDRVDEAVGSPGTIATLWKTWEPLVGGERGDVAA